MTELLGYQRRLWAEIDLDALEHNFLEAKRRAGGDVAMIAVVKADAYGHGAKRLAALYERLGADMLAVSNIEEAMELRRSGISLPILVLGYTPPECAEILAKERIEQCVYSLDYARALSDAAVRVGQSIGIHIKIDTGMGRIGFILRESEEDELSEAISACRLPMLETVGVFTHLAVADGGEDGREFTLSQANGFAKAIQGLHDAGIDPKVKHISNSAAIFDYPSLRYNAVRIGISLYGEPPSDLLISPPDLRPTMTLRSVISNIKTVRRGESVGYGRAFVAEKEMRVATVPIGYADGLFRYASSGKGAFAVCGKLAPILGRVCMDQTMIDVTDLDGVDIGTPVAVFGGGGALTAGELAECVGTISYEIFTSVARRVPRVYIKDGKIESVEDYII